MAVSSLFYDLQDYCSTIPKEFEQISEQRQLALSKIADYLREKKAANAPMRLLFACVQNSRRSVFAQAWMHAAGAAYGLPIATFSGGAVVDACNPRTVAALERAGWIIGIAPNGSLQNPRYRFEVGDSIAPIEVFSKSFADAINPKSGFAAITVCADGDACPIVPNAEVRIAIPYQDPKSADGTAQEVAAYDRTCREIAREMFWVASQV